MGLGSLHRIVNRTVMWVWAVCAACLLKALDAEQAIRFGFGVCTE